MKIFSTLAVSAAIATLCYSSVARATVLWTGSGTVAGNAVTASATFTISGTTLTIVLKNTSPAASKETPTNTLTGITFLLSGLDPVLTPVSAISPNAIFAAGDCDVNACIGTNVNVGGEWGYQNNYNGLEAIGSSGYVTTGLAGDLGNFNGLNLQGPDSLDGIQFGIISATHGPFNGGLGGQALIDDTVILTLMLPANFAETEIGDVSFLYGTSPDATVVGIDPPIPEPASLAMVGTALVGLALMRRRRDRGNFSASS